jgi:phenylalanyl-tRNA synthetase alpha chain
MNLRESLKTIQQEADEFMVSTKTDLEKFRLKFLVKKSNFMELFNVLKDLPPEERKDIGRILNEVKNKIEEKHKLRSEAFADAPDEKAEKFDYSLPPDIQNLGSRHPVSIVNNRIIEIFSKIGFEIEEGPEIEDDWHNFSALNFAENHPARDMQDTFFIDEEKGITLRTHTSNVQVRVMENNKPPVRILSPGRVYRNEAISARSNCFFHQVEGLYIDKDVSFADLKETLFFFVKEMYGNDIKQRFRPSYFPFTEPSAEMDITCTLCKGAGCNVCKYTGWLEILGCGMVHPNVLKNCNIDPEVYGGFAFGMGIERQAMLLNGVNDLRTFFENDLRFLRQFKVFEN